jgi:hypothetical protein
MLSFPYPKYAAIACTDIREEFCYQENVDGIPIWASTSDNHVIRLGSKIKFSVKSVQEESFLDIRGSLNLQILAVLTVYCHHSKTNQIL